MARPFLMFFCSGFFDFRIWDSTPNRPTRYTHQINTTTALMHLLKKIITHLPPTNKIYKPHVPTKQNIHQTHPRNRKTRTHIHRPTKITLSSHSLPPMSAPMHRRWHRHAASGDTRSVKAFQDCFLSSECVCEWWRW